jgi:plastin-1
MSDQKAAIKKDLGVPPGISEEKMTEYKTIFEKMDADGDGFVTEEELTALLKELKIFKNAYQVKTLVQEVDANNNGTIEFNEFLHIVHNDSKKNSAFSEVATKTKTLIQHKGVSDGAVHSLSVEELEAFTEHLNNTLGDDEDLKYLMPIDASQNELLTKVQDGVLLAKFINVAVADTIDERALNFPKKKPLSTFQINENLNLVVQAAKAIGCVTTNVGAGELSDGAKYPHLVLGMVWQLVKIELLNSISLKDHPELIRLLEPGEELADLLKLTPEQLLLRWFNYHLKNANHPERVINFSNSVADATKYTVLLNQIAPQTCDKSGLGLTDKNERAQKVLDNAKKLEVKAFIKAKDITKGNARLNLAFTAAIFNQCPGLDPVTQEDMEAAGLMDDDEGDSREERAFRMWINSLGLDGVYLNNLFDDVRDGLVLLKVINEIEPGLVDWKKAEMKPRHKLKKCTNNNYAVELCKNNPLKLSVVGIGGSDIVDGNKKLILGLVWQLMRFHTVKHVAKAQAHIFGGKTVTDHMMISWANEKVATTGSMTKISSFKDKKLNDGLFFLDLLISIESRVVNNDFVNREAESLEERMLNARYAISVARKLGATLFLLPDDIVEVKPKMMLTFIASIMAISK